MSTERKPVKNIVHETTITSDNRKVRVNAIKSLWRKACFARKEVLQEDGSSKRTWIQKDGHVSLKTFAHTHASSDASTAVVARNWFYNKCANTSNPPLGIGRTSKSKGSGSSSKKPVMSPPAR